MVDVMRRHGAAVMLRYRRLFYGRRHPGFHFWNTTVTWVAATLLSAVIAGTENAWLRIAAMLVGAVVVGLILVVQWRVIIFVLDSTSPEYRARRAAAFADEQR